MRPTRSIAEFTAATRAICAATRSGTPARRYALDLAKAKADASFAAATRDYAAAFRAQNDELSELERISPPPSSGVTATRWRSATASLRKLRKSINDGAIEIRQADSTRSALAVAARLMPEGHRLVEAAGVWQLLGGQTGLANACVRGLDN